MNMLVMVILGKKMRDTFKIFANPGPTPTEQLLQSLKVGYTRNSNGTYDVLGSIDVSSRDMDELPDLSLVRLEGSFFCDNNRLVSLKGAPQHVGGDFVCSGNKLETLEFASRTVGGKFKCGGNRLTSFAGGPEAVGLRVTALSNPITSAEGAPRSFKSLNCDLGSFDSPADFIEKVAALKAEEREQRAAALERAAAEAVVLSDTLKVSRPITFRGLS